MLQSKPRNNHLNPFFEPESVAVIGSFKEGVFGGYVVVKSLLEAGYKGEIYPVNPGSYREVLGLKVYPSPKEIPTSADVALLMINARHVPGVMEACADAGIKSIILVADGFAERDAEGARLQNEVVHLAKSLGIRIIGPNTAGIANAMNGFNPCPYDAGYYRFKKGTVAICSQTGMINPQAYPYRDLRYGIGKICDFGNKCDLDECDFLEYVENDSDTQVISVHVETVRDGKRFLEVCKKVALKKPLMILKLGVTEAGARASASHTGSLAIDDEIFDAACRQTGALRLDQFSELFDMPRFFASQPLPRGNRFGMVSYTGAVGVAALDEGARHGLVRARLSKESSRMLEDMFSGLGHVPVDIGPMIPSVKDFSAVYAKILTAVLNDENVDCLFNVIWADAKGRNTKAYVEGYEALGENGHKPVATWVYGPSVTMVRDLTKQLESRGFPVFAEPERCIKALGLAYRYAKGRSERM
ncbi:MAG: CoA-binding protein [Deltaproteobacteria bacterium]|nr:CoA-binding protein [Deltaproteobacteria bacterium]